MGASSSNFSVMSEQDDVESEIRNGRPAGHRRQVQAVMRNTCRAHYRRGALLVRALTFPVE